MNFSASMAGQFYLVGATIPECSQTVTLKASIDGANGQRVTWIRNGAVVGSTSIARDSQSAEVTVPSTKGDWFAIVVRDATGPTAFSAPIYCSNRD